MLYFNNWGYFKVCCPFGKAHQVFIEFDGRLNIIALLDIKIN